MPSSVDYSEIYSLEKNIIFLNKFKTLVFLSPQKFFVIYKFDFLNCNCQIIYITQIS